LRSVFAAAALLLACESAAAVENKVTLPVNLSVNVWESTGGSTWSSDVSAFEPRFGNPTSRLDYEGVDSTIVELRMKIGLPRGFEADLAYGAGDAEDGRLIDQDLLSAQGAASFGIPERGAHVYSEAASDLNGDTVWYFDIKLNKELFRSADDETRTGAGIRYLDWNEQYRARGVTQTICTLPDRLCLPAGFSGFNDRDAITNDARWRALFLGAWLSRRFGERFSLSGAVAYSPLADLASDDRHFLRADLSQSPSFRLTGTGQAAALEIDAAYALTPRLSAGIGFRYWWMEVRNEEGGFAVFPAGGEPLGALLRQFESERYGVILNLAYRFGPIN
jgi:hypothetical protein